jgi:hypothetical protein
VIRPTPCRRSSNPVTSISLEQKNTYVLKDVRLTQQCCRTLKSSGTWHCVTGKVVGNYLPNNTAAHPGTLKAHYLQTNKTSKQARTHAHTHICIYKFDSQIMTRAKNQSYKTCSVSILRVSIVSDQSSSMHTCVHINLDNRNTVNLTRQPMYA